MSDGESWPLSVNSIGWTLRNPLGRIVFFISFIGPRLSIYIDIWISGVFVVYIGYIPSTTLSFLSIFVSMSELRYIVHLMCVVGGLVHPDMTTKLNRESGSHMHEGNVEEPEGDISVNALSGCLIIQIPWDDCTTLMCICIQKSWSVDTIKVVNIEQWEQTLYSRTP